MVIKMSNRYAIIENSVVVNVVVADAELAEQNGWVACPKAGPGWSYVDGTFVEPVVTPITPITPTKEDLLAQLQQLQQQIAALSE